MKKIAVATLLASSLFSSSVFADSEKRITDSITMKPEQTLSINFPVGSLEVEIVDTNELTIEIDIEAKNDSWFSSDQDVSGVTLDKDIRDKRIKLEIDDNDLQQEWLIKVPKSAALDLEIGVGSVEISNLINSADIEVGVGSVRIATSTNDFKRIELESGVGDTAIRGMQGDLEQKRNMVSSESILRGNGQFSIEAEVGVGDIKVKHQ